MPAVSSANAAHAARQRAYVDRISRCVLLVPIEIDETRLNVLCKLRWLNEADHEHSRQAIASAIEGLLDSLIEDDA